ncbi:MAG: PA14 domain-containing protein [Myxococcota bacterium]
MSDPPAPSTPAPSVSPADARASTPAGAPADAPADGQAPADIDPHARAFFHADAHALAAASLLDDPSVPPWTAAEHLRRGFSALARAAGAPTPEPAAALDLSALPWLGSPQGTTEALRRLTDDDQAIEPHVLRHLARALSAAVRNAQDERFAPRHRRARRRAFARRLGMGLLVLVPLVAVLVWTVPDYREGPWRAELYASPDFSGEPIMRRDGDVKFDWKRRAPNPDLPEEGFSVRWDTCMRIDKAREIAFQLISDDGSRLYIDEQLVVDNWGRHGERSRGADVPLSVGVHHVRVEYFDERHSASVQLRASFHGEPPDSLPVTILRYPGDTLDPHDPCSAAREP